MAADGDSADAGARDGNGDGDVVSVSFEDTFDAELADELGDLGPDSPTRAAATAAASRDAAAATAAARDRGRRP